MSRDVKIGDLRIRVPGLSLHDARQLGQLIANRAGASLPEGGQRSASLGEVRVRVAAPAGSNRDSLVGLVAKAIAEALR
jgi:hypothetical protein